MKRPISILCLADVHYPEDGDMSVVEALHTEFTKYVDEDITRIKWEPDYIVIAGDVAFQNKGYNNARNFLEALRRTFNIKKDHVIIVPGNHDKNTKGLSVKQQNSEIEEFEKYCNDCVNNKERFGNVFERRFMEFLNFSKEYSTDLQYNADGANCILDERLLPLSGVKVFKEDHLCFLYINTEWLYYPGRDKSMVIASKLDIISDFVRLDEKCQLCAPLIKDAYNLIKENFKDYTVITVMHRGFEHFSYKERNVSDKATIDAIDDILKISDVIITGHDHVLSPPPPSLIRNKVQHFQLGLTGMKEHPAKEYLRSAEIIRLDLSGENVEQLIIESICDNNKREGWSFNDSTQKYPLFSKYLPKKEKTKILSNHNDSILKVQRFSQNDIKRAVHLYFEFENLTIVMANGEHTMEDLESIVKNNNKRTCHIVVCYDFYSYISDIKLKHKNEGLYVSKTKHVLDKFRENHIEEFMMGSIFVNEVVIEYSLLEFEKKNNKKVCI